LKNLLRKEIKIATGQRFLGKVLTLKFESQPITLKEGTAQRITQHKIFVPYGTHTNFCFAKTSFMSGRLYEISNPAFRKFY